MTPPASARGHARLRANMLLAFLPAILVMALCSLFSYAASMLYLRETDRIIAGSTFLAGLVENVDRVAVSLEGYLVTRRFESLNAYLQASYELRGKARGIDRSRSYDEGSIMLEDLGNLIDSYLASCDASMNARRQRDIPSYIASYREAGKIGAWIDRDIDRYNRHQLGEQSVRYSRLSSRIAAAQLAALLLIAVISILDLGFVVLTSRRMTGPIMRLAELADRVSQGDFDVGPMREATGDEIETLSGSIDRMVANMRSYLVELREKSALQEKLKEEEMRSLKMAGLLREAELHALQSQINPHFIFNTINAGVQLAMFENASRTGRFMDELARLLRYNLRSLDEDVELRDELDNARNYLSILGTRFGDRVDYRESVDEDALDAAMPRMILQPVLENAYIHGIGQRDGAGAIEVAARREGPLVVVTIRDDGVGMSPPKAAAILEAAVPGPVSSPRAAGHTTGIGMPNVASRLRLFTGREDAIAVESEEGRGTTVTIRLDRRGRG